MHLIVREVGKLKTFVLGDYRLSFGQGLVLNNDFVGSKAEYRQCVAPDTEPSDISPLPRAVLPSSGINEIDNFSLTFLLE